MLERIRNLACYSFRPDCRKCKAKGKDTCIYNGTCRFVTDLNALESGVYTTRIMFVMLGGMVLVCLPFLFAWLMIKK